MYVFFLLIKIVYFFFFFFSSRRRHTRCSRDWSSDVCSSDVLGEEEARQGGDDVRQDQDGDERQQDQAEQLARQQRSELLHAAEVLQNLVEHAEHAKPERYPNDCEDDQLPVAAAVPLLTEPLQRRAPLRLEHVPQRRLRHGASPLPSTSASSRTCAPPVSFKNSSSRLASPTWCWCRRSATVPEATIRPCWMIAILSHIASATSRVWVLIRTVPPLPTNWRKMSFSNRAALGSRPTIGSSTTMHSGRWMSALEMISF